MSWEDIFEMRLFSSYITKESNVHDHRIQNHQTAQNFLYGSENIHQRICNTEQEAAWKY
jgi:hypothetical protein